MCPPSGTHSHKTYEVVTFPGNSSSVDLRHGCLSVLMCRWRVWEFFIEDALYKFTFWLIDWLIYDWLQTTAKHDITWSMWAGDHGELFFCGHLNRECQFHTKSNELTDAFLACPPDWAQGPSLLRDKLGLPLPGGAGQFYPSCGFCLTVECRCFKISNPCRAIPSTAFVHHTALTDRDF